MASECNEDVTTGPRPLKSRGVQDYKSSMFRFVHTGDIQTDACCYVLHSEVQRSATPSLSS